MAVARQISDSDLIFVNKMDQAGTDPEKVLTELQEQAVRRLHSISRISRSD